MAKGKVKWFSDEKGYGFITPDDGSKDVFVHYTGLPRPTDGGRRVLFDQQAVEFEVVASDKGPKAVNVRVL